MKYFKNIRKAVCLMIGLTVLVGCSSLGFGGKPTDEEMYDALNHFITNPTSNDETQLKVLRNEFTFSALVSEKTSMTIDDKQVNMAYAFISRNMEDTFLLDLSYLSNYDYPAGTYLSITGTLNGNIYWTNEDDSEEITVLDIAVKKVEELGVSSTKPKEDAVFALTRTSGTSTYNFDKATATQSMSQNAAYLYFSFENTTDVDQLPKTSELTFFQGDVELKSTIMGGTDSIEEDATDIHALSNVSAKETKRIVETLVPYYDDEAMNDTDPIEIYQYDDNFNLIQFWLIDLQ